MGFVKFVVGFTHTNLCVIFSHKLAQISCELFFVGDEGGEIGGNWEKISTFVCANMRLLFNPLKFYDYDEH